MSHPNPDLRPRSLRRDLDELSAAFGPRTAVVVELDPEPVTFTYAELARLVDRCAAEYAARGLCPGDRVLALLPNAVETLVAALAALRTGLGFAPLPCTATADETRRWAQLVAPRLVLTTSILGEGGRAALATLDLPRLELPIDARFEWLTRDVGRAPSDPQRPGRLFLATSGTTGEPSAIVIDTDRLWSAGCAFLAHHGLDWRQRDAAALGPRFWNYLPMSYLGGLFNLALIPLAAGGSLVISEPFSGKTFLSFWQTVQRFDIDALWFVPTIVRGLLQMSARVRNPAELLAHGARIHTAYLGTAPIDLGTKQRFERTFGLTMLENFGLSETTFVTSERAGALEHRRESGVGAVLPYAEVKLVPIEEDSELREPAPDGEAPARTPTEVRVKTPFLFEGYLRADGTLDPRVDADGFLSTGDLGHIDEHGALVLDGRRRDAIKKGGYFVSLREVEVTAQGLGAVAEAAAVRVPHAFYGESYVLYFIPAAGQTPGADLSEAVGRELRERLNRYKWPEDVIAVADFPRTSSGKVRKHLLRSPEGSQA